MRSVHFTLLVAVAFNASCGRTDPGQIDASRTPPRADRPGSATPGATVAVTATVSEFEGSYQVGDTHCVVKPIKMAFEVTWEKGNGAMLFFFDSHTPEGKAVFVSKQTANSEDRFVFDDDQYVAGRFIRSDGKEFAVSKAVGR